MAFLAQDDDQDLTGQQATQSQPLVGGQSNVTGQASGGSQGTGAGKGGQGGFVNLQNYLSANAGDTGSASALKETVGSQFGKEEQDMQKGADDYYTQAKTQVDSSKISNADADKMLDESAQQYKYGAGNSSNLTYSGNVDKVKGALNGQYTGPKSYEYGLGGKTQEYGTAVGKDGNFDGLMKNIYSQRTPNALSQGQYNLQKQLDVSNSNLTNTRDELANQYGGLNTKRDEVVKGTTEKLGGLEQDYRQSQNQLRDYLAGKSTGLETSINQQEADARKAYDQALRTGTGTKSLGYDTIVNIAGNNTEIGPRAQLGVWGDNLNYDQLQREVDGFNSGALKWYTPDRDPELARRNAMLSSFYGDQDSKYKDVADMDERKFNTLLDFLGSDGPRREEGFQVRKK